MVMSIESYQDKFMQDIRPYWKLYGGRNSKTLIAKNTEMENIDEAWSMLSQQLNRYSKGTFKILTFSNPDATLASAWEALIKIGDTIGSANQPQNFNNMQFFQMMQYFQSQSDANAKAAVAAAEARAKEQMEFMKEMIALKNEKAALEGTLAAGNESAKEQLVGELIASVPPLVDAFTDLIRYKFMPDFQPVNQAQLGTMGQKNIEAESNSDKVETPKKGVSFDRLAMAAQRMQKALPQYHVNDLLDLLAAFCEEKPKEAAFLINKLKGDG